MTRNVQALEEVQNKLRRADVLLSALQVPHYLIMNCPSEAADELNGFTQSSEELVETFQVIRDLINEAHEAAEQIAPLEPVRLAVVGGGEQ